MSAFIFNVTILTYLFPYSYLIWAVSVRHTVTVAHYMGALQRALRLISR